MENIQTAPAGFYIQKTLPKRKHFFKKNLFDPLYPELVRLNFYYALSEVKVAREMD